MTSFLLQCKPNTLPEKGVASTHEYLGECTHNGENQRWLRTAIYVEGSEPFFRADTTRPLAEHLRLIFKNSDQWSRRRRDNEFVTLLSKGQLAILKMAAVRSYLLTDQNRLRAGASRHWEEFIGKFRQNSSGGFGGDAMTVKIKDGCRWPYLSKDQNHFRAAKQKHLGFSLDNKPLRSLEFSNFH